MHSSRLFLVQIWQGADGHCAAVLGADQAGDAPQRFGSAAALAQYLFAASDRASGPCTAATPLSSRLSSRESEVALLFAGGSNHKRIALQLGLSPATVRNHLSACYRKLHVDNRSALLWALAAPHEHGAAMVHLHHGAATAQARDWTAASTITTTSQGEHR